MHAPVYTSRFAAAAAAAVYREVDDLLLKEAQLEEGALETVGWGVTHAEETARDIRALIRSSAAAAFAKSKRGGGTQSVKRLEATSSYADDDAREKGDALDS